MGDPRSIFSKHIALEYVHAVEIGNKNLGVLCRTLLTKVAQGGN